MTLGLLYCQYEIVHFGYRPLLAWQRVVAILYGIALIVLGAILLGKEMGNIGLTCDAVWATMSSNQRAFFSNQVTNLRA